MGLFDIFSRKRQRVKFAERVMTRLWERGWEHPMAFDPARFAIELGGEAGNLSLGMIFQDWSSYPRRDQAAALDQAIAFVFELGPPPPFEDAADLLIPIVRARSVIDAALYDRPEEPEWDIVDAWRPLCAHLAIRIAIERPHSLMPVGAETLRAWERTFDECLEVALANLRRKAPPAFVRQDGGYWRLECEDSNEIARLLIPGVFAEAELNGSPIVVAGARDCVLVAGADDEAGLEAMGLVIPRVLDDHPRPISYAPMILEGGEWRLYEPPARLYAMRALQQVQKAHDYEQQLPLVLHRLEQQGRPREVAQFSLIPTDEGVRSMALWIAPSCLLPRADLIVGRIGAGATWIREWDDVAAANGGFPEEPETASPYYRVSGWPEPKTMAQIIAAPEPVWAKGKGLGVANGRLTLFG